MKYMNKSIWVLLITLVCATTLVLKTTTPEKELVSKSPFSAIKNIGLISGVWILNGMSEKEPGHVLPVTLSGVTANNGDSIDKTTFWPAIGETVYAVGPKTPRELKKGYSDTLAAAFSRYFGLKTGVIYSLEQDVILPGAAPLKFVQSFEGPGYSGLAGKSWIGVSLQDQNGHWKETQFEGKRIGRDDWHQEIVPHFNAQKVKVGEYVIDYCFSHQRYLPGIPENMTIPQGLACNSGIVAAGATVLGFGMGNMQGMEEGQEIGKIDDALLRQQKIEEAKRFRIENYENLKTEDSPKTAEANEEEIQKRLAYLTQTERRNDEIRKNKAIERAAKNLQKEL